MSFSRFDLVRKLRRIVRRRWIDERLDALRFAIDTFPAPDYHPLPWFNKTGERAEGTYSRWTEISRIAEEKQVRSAVDIGANIGFFSLSLALRGVDVVAIEREPKARRIFSYTKERLGLDNAALTDLSVTERSVGLLPRADLVLFLSVWHHMVREHGLDLAREMLGRIWERCDRVMVFDTGQEEMPSYFGLPRMEPTPRLWVGNLLTECCGDGRVEYLGEHAAFDPAGRQCMRSLFAVHRQASGQ